MIGPRPHSDLAAMMHHIIHTSWLHLSLLFLFLSYCLSDAEILEPSDGIVKANIEFTLDIFAKLDKSKNVFISPYSILSGLVLAYIGAEGKTKQQMKHVLHFGNFPEKYINEGFLKINNLLNRHKENITLRIANKIFTQKGLELHKTYIENINHYYGGNQEQICFALSSTINHINQWVTKQTSGKINTIIEKIDPSVQLLILNAVYFKGNWQYKFEVKKTKTQHFKTSSGDLIDVKIMEQNFVKLLYKESNEFQAVELPYSGNQFSMVVILPKTYNGLLSLEPKLTYPFLKKLMNSLTEKNTINILKMPKFKLELSYDLRHPLQNMGMVDAFSNHANFKALTSDSSLKIDKIIQKTFIEVNEMGSEAAAVTILASARMASFEQPQHFIADHPFIFFIKDNSNKNILFFGRIESPPFY